MGQNSTPLPWFPFYPQDFLTSEKVRGMTYEEVGIYLMLLCFEWIQGSVPENVADILRCVLKVSPMSTTDTSTALATERVVAQCFVTHPTEPNRILNPKLERIRRQQSQEIQRRKHAARKGGQARARQCVSIASAQPKLSRSIANASLLDEIRLDQSRLEKRKTPPLPPHGGVSAFGVFWAAYPKKRSKGQAEKAWTALKPSEQLQGLILAALKRATTSVEWAKDGGRFIPHAATWLRAKGWEDELHDDPIQTWKPP